MNIKTSIGICGLAGLLILSSCGTKKNILPRDRAIPQGKEQIQPSTPQSTQTTNSESEAPVTAEQRMRRYVEAFAPIAIEEMHLYRIPASITLAQGILESGSGSGALAISANNHFGIKCHTTWTGERVYHDDDELGECFRKYADVKYSYRDHSLFLTQRSRYADLFKLKISDYQGWARGLKKAGYATDPKYPDKLISLIERFDLWKYDEGTALTQQSGSVENGNSSQSTNRLAINTENRVYVVVAGDTLYSLSKRFGLTVDQIIKHNNLESIDLSIGQELQLPQ